ncbi:chaperone NapD [Stutzerimonas sp. NM35]|uniref:chaperone NapD n=1 Tax=Stutzerimonas stutzeri TaxID=316 RepID=UPI0015E314DA|nr:chaperone NapD [Stutzerimonas stutzeri]MBA1263402.1 chaperone NapD [Stutzerimonas stutzeri]
MTKTNNDALHIASLLVHCRPELLDAVKRNLALLPGLELHQESAAGKVVVVLEAEHESRILDTIDHIQQLPGVLNAALIYHELLTLEGEA